MQATATLLTVVSALLAVAVPAVALSRRPWAGTLVYGVSLAASLAAVAIGGAPAAVVGTLLARCVDKHHRDYYAHQIEHGGMPALGPGARQGPRGTGDPHHEGPLGPRRPRPPLEHLTPFRGETSPNTPLPPTAPPPLT